MLALCISQELPLFDYLLLNNVYLLNISVPIFKIQMLILFQIISRKECTSQFSCYSVFIIYQKNYIVQIGFIHVNHKTLYPHNDLISDHMLTHIAENCRCELVITIISMTVTNEIQNTCLVHWFSSLQNSDLFLWTMIYHILSSAFASDWWYNTFLLENPWQNHYWNIPQPHITC